MASKSPRYAVIELLQKVAASAYSNLALDGALSASDYYKRDKAFISRLFYGVIDRKLTLDYIISLYSKKPLQKLDGSVVAILETGLYQILYMDSVPDSAAVDESVKLVRKCGRSSAAGFVNAVLRSFLRDGKKYPLPKDSIKRLSVEFSCGEALARRLTEQYGYDTAARFLADSLSPHKLYLRVNNVKTTADNLLSQLAENGISAKASEITDNCIEAESMGGIEDCTLFAEGMFHVQDLSSQLCCKALAPHSGEVILDICAAPGGKSFTIAEMTGDSCQLYSCELHKKRAELIRKGAERLGLSSMKPLQNDAKIYNENFPQFDKILCDVPCSGTGVIRSKPEIKYLDMDAAARLPEIQYAILETAARYLKSGGELVYSTCSVLKDENDDVIDRFLREHGDFEGVSFLEDIGKPFGGYKAVIFPSDLDCEGFFISKIRKK